MPLLSCPAGTSTTCTHHTICQTPFACRYTHFIGHRSPGTNCGECAGSAGIGSTPCARRLLCRPVLTFYSAYTFLSRISYDSYLCSHIYDSVPDLLQC